MFQSSCPDQIAISVFRYGGASAMCCIGPPLRQLGPCLLESCNVPFGPCARQGPSLQAVFALGVSCRIWCSSGARLGRCCGRPQLHTRRSPALPKRPARIARLRAASGGGVLSDFLGEAGVLREILRKGALGYLAGRAGVLSEIRKGSPSNFGKLLITQSRMATPCIPKVGKVPNMVFQFLERHASNVKGKEKTL